MSQDDEVLTCNDSRIILHRLCRTPRNCQCKWLSAFLKAQWISADSFPFSVKFLFYTDTLESIVLPNLVPRLRIGDCFEIHNLHWELCDLLLSSHQNFLLEVGLCQCVFCKEPLSSWSSCISRNSDLSGSEYKYCACPIQLLSRVLDLLREKNLRLCPLAPELFRPRDSLWIPPNQADRATGLPVLRRCPHLYFGCRFFWVLETGRPVLDFWLRVTAGRNAESTTSCGNDVADVLVVELDEPVDNPGTTIGT